MKKHKALDKKLGLEGIRPCNDIPCHGVDFPKCAMDCSLDLIMPWMNIVTAL